MRSVLVLLVVACGGDPKPARAVDPIASPGCSVVSCCGGEWVWDGLACVRAAPPYCGCYCAGPPAELFASEQACRAARRR